MVEITTHKEEDIYSVVVDGEVDASSSILLDNEIRSALESETKVLVDLSALTYISSAGLGVFVSHLEEIEKRGISLALFGLSESVLQVFSLLGLQALLNIAEDKNEAIKAVS